MSEKLDFLAIAAHPDDTELCCSGTLAALVRQGHRVGVLDLTRGEMGTRGTPELRLQEAKDAAGILGLAVRENIGLPDNGLDNIPDNQLKIIEMIRRYQPDICFINAPDCRHPDHRNAARLTLDALFYAGLRKLETRYHDELQKPWRPYHTLHYMQDRPFTPTFVFDISETIDIKKQAIKAFSSQFNVLADDDEPATYVSSKRFFDMIIARARHYGHMIGAEYGEPFLYANSAVPLQNFDQLLQTKPSR